MGEEAVAVGHFQQAVLVGQLADALQQVRVLKGNGDVATEDFEQVVVELAQGVPDVDEGRHRHPL